MIGLRVKADELARNDAMRERLLRPRIACRSGWWLREESSGESRSCEIAYRVRMRFIVLRSVFISSRGAWSSPSTSVSSLFSVFEGLSKLDLRDFEFFGPAGYSFDSGIILHSAKSARALSEVSGLRDVKENVCLSSSPPPAGAVAFAV